MYNFLMKFLGIDFGTKNIGLAVSDEDGRFAIDIPLVKNNDKVIDLINSHIKDNNIKGIVIGMPGLDKENEITLKIKRFALKLGSITGIKIDYWDESFTSQRVESGLRGKKRKTSDSKAARIILQEFLDFNSSKR